MLLLARGVVQQPNLKAKSISQHSGVLMNCKKEKIATCIDIILQANPLCVNEVALPK